MGTTTSSRSVIPQAPDVYDVSDQQRTRTTIEQRLEDIERALYGLSTSFGTLSLGQETLTLSNGSNNDIAPGYAPFVRIEGPTGAFTITGIIQGELGRIMMLRNTTTQAMTIANQSVSSTDVNRIITQTGADLVTTNEGSAILMYDAVDQRWVVIAAQL